MENLFNFTEFLNEALAPAKPAFSIVDEKYKTDTSVAFVTEMLKVSKSVMADFKLSIQEVKTLMTIGFGILFRESDAGSSMRYKLRTLVGAFKMFGAAPSEGLTQIKFDVNFSIAQANQYHEENKRLIAKYNLSDGELSKPEGAARATLVLLARLYNTAKQRKYSGVALIHIVIIAYNVGANTVLKNPKHGKGADTFISQKVPNYIPNLKTNKTALQKGVPVHISTEGYYNEVMQVGKAIKFA